MQHFTEESKMILTLIYDDDSSNEWDDHKR